MSKNAKRERARIAALSYEKRMADCAAGVSHCAFCDARFESGLTPFNQRVFDEVVRHDREYGTAEEWAQEAKLHKPDCIWVELRGQVIISA